MPEKRRTATLLTFAQHIETVALDDVLDTLIADLFRDAERRGQKKRLRQLEAFDQAALRLLAACEVLLDESLPGSELREAIFARVPEAELAEATATVEEVARAPREYFQDELLGRWRTVRCFLPTLLGSISFGGIPTAALLWRSVYVEGSRRWDDPRAKLVLFPLDKLDEPESLVRLREQVKGLMPRLDLSEVLLEVQA